MTLTSTSQTSNASNSLPEDQKQKKRAHDEANTNENDGEAKADHRISNKKRGGNVGVFSKPRDVSKMIWVTIGKTEHQAWMIDENPGRQGEVLIQWESTRRQEYVPADAIRVDIPMQRRRTSRMELNVKSFSDGLAAKKGGTDDERKAKDEKPARKRRRKNSEPAPTVRQSDIRKKQTPTVPSISISASKSKIIGDATRTEGSKIEVDDQRELAAELATKQKQEDKEIERMYRTEDIAPSKVPKQTVENRDVTTDNQGTESVPGSAYSSRSDVVLVKEIEESRRPNDVNQATTYTGKEGNQDDQKKQSLDGNEDISSSTGKMGCDSGNDNDPESTGGKSPNGTNVVADDSDPSVLMLGKTKQRIHTLSKTNDENRTDQAKPALAEPTNGEGTTSVAEHQDQQETENLAKSRNIDAAEQKNGGMTGSIVIRKEKKGQAGSSIAQEETNDPDNDSHQGSNGSLDANYISKVDAEAKMNGGVDSSPKTRKPPFSQPPKSLHMAKDYHLSLKTQATMASTLLSAMYLEKGSPKDPASKERSIFSKSEASTDKKLKEIVETKEKAGVADGNQAAALSCEKATVRMPLIVGKRRSPLGLQDGDRCALKPIWAAFYSMPAGQYNVGFADDGLGVLQQTINEDIGLLLEEEDSLVEEASLTAKKEVYIPDGNGTEPNVGVKQNQ